jgi:cobalt-zinc-cadmium efflux system outer membrane protein
VREQPAVQSLPALASQETTPRSAPLPPLPETVRAEPIHTAPIAAGQALSLADLEQMALGNNPSLAESISKINALRGKWEQVGLPTNPYAGYSDQQLGSPDVEQRGVIFGQELVRHEKLTLNRAVVCQEIQRAQQEYIAQQYRVLTDVRINFIDALEAQQRSLIAAEILKSAAGVVEITQKRLAAKEIGRADLLQAKVEYESAVMIQKRSEFEYLEAWRKLTASIGVPTLPYRGLQGRWDELPPLHEWEPTLQHLLSRSPEIAAARAEIQRARWAYQRATVEKKPNITFQGIVQDDRSVNATNGALQITLPIPIYNRNQGGVAQAGHDALAAERALDKLQLDLQQRLATVFQRYQTAQAQVERYRQAILPDSRENLELTSKAYHAGEYDFLQMLVAQRTFAHTNLAYLEALQDLRVAAQEIDGLMLSNSLGAGN